MQQMFACIFLSNELYLARKYEFRHICVAKSNGNQFQKCHFDAKIQTVEQNSLNMETMLRSYFLSTASFLIHSEDGLETFVY